MCTIELSILQNVRVNLRIVSVRFTYSTDNVLYNKQKKKIQCIWKLYVS